MIDKPVFHAHITVCVLDPNRVRLLLEDEGEERLITGASCGWIAERIDGHHTVDEIVDEFQNRVAPAEIYYLLQTLESGGYLTSANSKISPGVSSFWRTLGVEPEFALELLGNSTVSLVALGATDVCELQDALSQLGVRVAPDAGCRVVLTDDYLNKDLHALNTEMLSTRSAWMISKPLGKTQWLGPIFRPGVTGCWYCLAHRLRENRNAANSAATQGENSGARRSCAALPSSIAALLNITATEIAKWLVLGNSESLEGAVWTMDSRLSTRIHYLTRRPQCPCCGDPTLSAIEKQTFQLRSQSEHPLVCGSRRTATAEETVQKLEHHMSPITGIIPIVRKASVPANPTAHVYVALQNDALSADEPSGAIGKGMSDADAMASCLAEAVERYSCRFHGCERGIRARYSDLTPNAISPTKLMNFSDRQYSNRDEWNQTHGSFQWVPEPFDQTLEIDWTLVWSLTREMERYVPTAYCYFRYPGEDCRFFPADSNGCASGNTREEAVLHGMLELVERDSVALWWYSRAKRPAVDLAGFNDPFLAVTIENLRRVGRSVNILDLTSDLGIPAFAAVSWKEDGTQIVMGSGADLDPHIGAVRAVSEMNQLLEFAAREGAEPARRLHTTDLSRWLRTARIEDHSYLVSFGEIQARDMQNISSNDILNDIWSCKGILEGHGLEVLALEMTRPDIGFPTVRMIVPGLRHFWARLAPGRLYNVPLELGWIARPLSEPELNPTPYML
jgi:bacteriocin biosynthesis cyclodehydratase domain-containing protein